MTLVYDATSAFDLKLMRGVAAQLQARSRSDALIDVRALAPGTAVDVAQWRADGIIANVDDPELARTILRSGLPVVGFGRTNRNPLAVQDPSACYGYVFSSNRGIAAVVVEHLLERGIQRVAYCGYPETPAHRWSAERGLTFLSTAADSGLKVTASSPVGARPFPGIDLQRAMGDWIAALPKPVGILAADDHIARELLDVCRLRHIAVPDDVAVIGVDNDELVCQLGHPPLSSVEHSALALGRAVVDALEEVMDGRAPEAAPVGVAPLGVVARASTDLSAITHPVVSRALACIRDHASTSLRVQDVVRAAAVSRSTLEKRFRSVLHCTIGDAIRRAHLQRARQLILDTDLPLKQVAGDSGFKTVQHLTTSFVRTFGETPGKFRRSKS